MGYCNGPVWGHLSFYEQNSQNYYNHIYRFSKYSNPLSLAYQVPLHKKDNPNECNNYRGIAITICFLNSVHNHRIIQFLESNLMNDKQAAFRKEYTTVDHIVILKSLPD